ncbi:MAG TPA: hypothetical protein VF190_08225 [Rhodothermales bacterium]
MISNRLPLPLLLLALLSGACEDPSNVGLGLIGESGGAPEVVPFAVQSFDTLHVSDIMGGAILVGSSSNTTPRFIAGTVDDPLVGPLSAIAHVDFVRGSGISDAFEAGPITAAEIRLTRDYVYGDTTSIVQFELLEIPGDWDARAPVDTTITLGATITTQSVTASDRSVVIPLPIEWIDDHSALIRSENFNDDFKGFALRSRSGNAVMGFAATSARLRVVSAGDTVDYIPTRALTTTTLANDTENDLLVQDGTGDGLTITLPDLGLGPAGVNAVLVRIPADTLAAPAPPNFVRPLLGGLRLVGRILGPDDEILDSFVADALLREGEYVWPIGAVDEGFFQDVIAGARLDLSISAPPTLFTLSPVVLAPPASANPPVVVVTLTRAGL